MIRGPLGGSPYDDDDDFVPADQADHYYTGTKALHEEAAACQRQVPKLIPISAHALLPGHLAYGQRHACTADVLALIAAYSESTQAPMR